MHIDKLDNIGDKYNNTYHRTIKSMYIDFAVEINDEGPKLEVGDHVRISKYKNIFAKRYTPNCSKEVFMIKKVKNTVPWTYISEDLNGWEIDGMFYEKNSKRPEQI